MADTETTSESVLVTEASKLMAKNLAQPLPIPKVAEMAASFGASIYQYWMGINR